MTLKVLIADDSATIQKIVTLAFGCEDAIVRSTSDGTSALEAIRDFRPDVILADIFMPGYSGYELCERVKDSVELSAIPVILLTGTFEPFDEQEALRVGSDGHLTKPFDTSELIEMVHSLAAKREKAQDSEKSLETTGMDMQAKAVSSPETPRGKYGPISEQVWESFLGSDRILDLFDKETLREAEIMRSARDRADSLSAPPSSPRLICQSSEKTELTDSSLDLIVEKVMQRLSADVVREVAWEVVPELSENIIRRTIEEQKKS